MQMTDEQLERIPTEPDGTGNCTFRICLHGNKPFGCVWQIWKHINGRSHYDYTAVSTQPLSKSKEATETSNA